MADLREVYDLSITGNFEQKLRELRDSIEGARENWQDLANTFRSQGAVFRLSKKELKEQGIVLDDVGKKANKAAEKQVKLNDSTRALARASNRLVAEQNRLNETYLAEATALDQLVKKAEPRIIQARAEALAMQKLTKHLVGVATQREFERLAAEAGLDVHQKTAKLFDAEAVAAERAAKAQQELAVATALAQRGLDPRGKPLEVQGPALPGTATGGKLSADQEKAAALKVLSEKQKVATDAYLKQLRIEAGLLDANGEKIGRATKEVVKSGEAAKAAESPFNRFLFTFRRLVGVMAVFTVARTVVSGFNSMIAGAVRFNAAIESNRVGLAGLIAAAGDVRDLQGSRLSLDQQLNVAQNIAIDQMGKLRAEALQTAASYEEISTAFTQAVAPGISAGLTLDEIRKVTVNISQAATGLGVAQNQLSEEIRSLFQGTINPRNTRIATALGITPQDIKRAKETGQLFEFISTRFAAISKTGEKLMNTFTGQLSNAADAFSQLLATASKPLFEQLKSGLSELQKGIFDIVNGAAVFNPQALKAFQGLFDGLARGVLGIRKAFETINIQGLADSLGLVGEVLGFVAAAIAKAFSVFFEIAAPSVTFAKAIFAVFTSLVGAAKGLDTAFFGFFSGTVKAAAQVSLLYFVFSKVVGAAKVLSAVTLRIARLWAVSVTRAGAARIATLKWGAAVSFVRTKLLSTLVPLLLIIGAFTLLTKLLPEGAKNTLLDGLADGLNSLTSGLDAVFDRMVKLPEEATKATEDGVGQVGDNLSALAGDIQDVIKDLQKTLRGVRADTEISLNTSGLSPGVASQMQTFYKTLKDAKESLVDTDNRLLETQTKITRAQQDQASYVRQFARENNISTDSVEDLVLNYNKLSTLDKNRLRDLQQISILAETDAKAAEKRLSELNKQSIQQGLFTDLSDPVKQFEALKGSSEDHLKSLKTIVDFMGQLKILYDEQAKLASFKADVEAKALDVAVAQLAVEAKKVNFEALQQRGLEEQRANAVLQENILQAAIAGSQTKAALAQAEFDTVKAQIDIDRQKLTFQRDELSLIARIDDALQSTNEETRAGAPLLRDQLGILRDMAKLDEARLRSIKKLAEEEKRRAGIRDSGTFGQGFKLGAQDFADANKSFGTIGENFAKNSAEALSSFVGTSFRSALASAFDPTQNFDLQAAIVNLGLDIAASLITDVAKNAIGNLFKTGAVAATAAAAVPAAGTAVAENATELIANTTATLSNTGASAANTGSVSGLITAMGALGIALEANTGAQFATAGLAKGGLAKFPTGGKILTPPGFARGGVAGMGPFAGRSRRLGLDSRDTIPAWLRPGEWVIRPEAVKHYGHDFMSALNSRKINPALARGLGPSAAPAQPPKRSFATGGAVVEQRGSRKSQVVTQRVVQFNDEQTMDRALAAGNNSMLRFARQKRSAYRAALGI